MSYDGFYPGLSTRGTTNDILDQALAVQAIVVPLAAQVQTQSNAVATAAGVIVPLVPTFQQAVVDAQSAATASQGSASASASSASASAGSAATSGTSATNAASSATLSQQWANNPEDVIVADGKFSSYHWAQKAQAVVIGGGGAVYMQKANNLSDVSNITVARSNLGLGSAALSASTDFQPTNANLTAISGQTLTANSLLFATGPSAFSQTTITAFGRSLIDDSSATVARTTLGLGTAAVAASTDFQPVAAKLTNFNATTNTADSLTYNTAASTFGVTPLTSFARSLLDDADAATARATLGVTSGDASAMLKAWANFTDNGTTCTINSSFNVSSVSRSASGRYTVAFSTPMTNINYGVVGSGGAGTAAGTQVTVVPSPTTVRTLTLSYIETTQNFTGTASSGNAGATHVAYFGG